MVNHTTHKLRINPHRFESNFEALSQIGVTYDGGVHRPTFSHEHLHARSWFRERINSTGLEYRQDSAGNRSAFLACGPAHAPTLLLGSHLDSVPNGGCYDGALGVLAALEVIETIKDTAISLPFHLEAIDFTDEEGTLIGLMGSSALTGKLTPAELEEPRGGRQNLIDGLFHAGLDINRILDARRDTHTLAGYLELHIEQGSRLEKTDTDIGIVTSIAGIGSYRLTFIGRADHAGTTSMLERRDAAQGASAFTMAVREIIMSNFPDCVGNVGQMHFEPGAFNIIPERVTLSLEYRAPEADTFDQLETALLDSARQQAERFDLDVEIEFLGKHLPAPMSTEVQASIRVATETLGLTAISLASGAGHDAQSLADLCPAGMIFVPSVGGASHSPREFTHWGDCLNGANTLLQAILNFAENFPVSTDR
jgi:N-carbamoyl-L-amino-acid hydrolase